MKKYILLLAAIAAACGTQAQNKDQGKIEYDFTINAHANLKPDQQQFKDMIPEKITQQMELNFNGDRACVTSKMKESGEEKDGVTVKVAFGSAENGAPEKTFYDVTTQKKYDLLTNDGKEKLKSYPFMAISTAKQGTRTKKILGYSCREVTVEDYMSKKPMTLWVTTELPFRWGPMGISVPDGAVLGIESKGFSAMATNISFKPVNRTDVTIPGGVPIEEGEVLKPSDLKGKEK